jgi:two-component system chemotaxis sensor kinase CheA
MTDSTDELDIQLLGQMREDFLEESAEQLDQLNLDLVKLEENPEDTELINEIFRIVHTLKGGASFVQLDGIREVAHVMEDVFGAIRKGSVQVTGSMIDVMLEALETLVTLRAKAAAKDGIEVDTSWIIQELRAIAAPPVSGEVSVSSTAPESGDNVLEVAGAHDRTPRQTRTPPIIKGSPLGSETIRVGTDKLDNLMNLVGELITGRNRLKEFSDRLGNDELERIVSTIERLTGQIRSAVMNVRMVPIERLFTKFPGAVRNLARQHGKEVELILEGRDTELDKTVLEQMHDPLMHLLRNAIDHGIEPPEERRRLGKRPEGVIRLSSRHQKSGVVIEAADDGRGIDPRTVREAAVRKGLITREQAAEMTDDQAIQLIFAPGFSTSEKVTDVSGRGVGTDVVRDHVQRLRGLLDVRTVVGKGTVFRIQLPLTLAILDVLMVRVSGLCYALPLNTVTETMLIESSDIKTMEKQEMIFVRGRAHPLKRLGALLQHGPAVAFTDKFIPVVLVGLAEKRVALAVDELLGKREVVMKPLGEYLGRIEGIEGASVLADGTVTLIVDVEAVLTMEAGF